MGKIIMASPKVIAVTFDQSNSMKINIMNL